MRNATARQIVPAKQYSGCRTVDPVTSGLTQRLVFSAVANEVSHTHGVHPTLR
jgi:hypothetical protein